VTTSRAVAGSEPPTRVRWIVLSYLVAASFVLYLLRSNLSIAGEAMMSDLGIDKVQLSLVLAAFAWGYGLFQFPGGVIGDRLGSRRTLTVLALAWGVLTIAVGSLPGALTTTSILILLIGLRFLMGVAQAPFFPVTSGGTIGRWFPVAGWGLPNGLMSMGLTLGAAATAPLVAWLTFEFGWRLGFVIVAPTAFILAFAWWRYARDEPGEHPAVNQAELEWITRGRPEQADSASWRDVLRNRDLLLLTLSYFCMNYVFYIFFNWYYIYLPALATGSFFAIVGTAAWLAIRADHPMTRNRGVAR